MASVRDAEETLNLLKEFSDEILTEAERKAVIIGFMSNELISIVENAGLMGVPMPAAITKAIDVLQSKGKKE